MTDQATTDGEGSSVGLLPCPFCGNDVASQGFWYGCAPGDEPRGYHVFCLECGETDALDGPRRDTLEEAIIAWNTRAQPRGEGTEAVALLQEVIANHEAAWCQECAIVQEGGDLRNRVLSLFRSTERTGG